MLIARQKRKENIAEYVLYMWQIEDMLRAESLDIENIKRDIVSRYDASDELRAEITDWYENLALMMQKEHLQQGGHLQVNKNMISSLNDLHLQLLQSVKFPDYGAEFYRTLPYIVELRSRSGESKSGEIETCFNALYGTLLLRLAGKQISEETTRAIQQISRFLALLSKYFKKDEERPLFSDDDEE